MSDTVALLKHLAEEGHKVSKNKIQLCREQVKYLGHHLSAAGRTIFTDRKTIVLQAPKPETKKQMSFLGLVNYCRAWMPNYAEIASPLSKLMYEKDISMSTKLQWTPEAEEAFCKVKQALAKSRADLKSEPLTKGEVVFVDGSSKKNEYGKTQTGYAVVTHTKIIEAKQLPSNYSAQAAELVALTAACTMMKDKEVTIYTDSQYAFASVHTFAQYWQNRGMVNSTGN